MKKIKSLLGIIICFLFCLLIFTLIKILKTLNIYKIYISYSELHRIGSVLDFEINHSICQRLKKKRKFIYIYSQNVSNSFIVKKLKLHGYTIIKIPIFWSYKFEYLKKIFGKIFFEKRNFDFKVIRNNKRNKTFYIFNKNNKLLFKLDRSEIDFCEKILRENKIDPNKKFASFHLRDSLYLKKKFPKENWDHHLLRDYNKETFFDAVNYLTEKEYNVFILGNVQNKFELKDDNLFDYANSNFKNDILDFYLSTKCKFFFATMSGLDMIPYTQSTPMIYLMIDFPFAKDRKNILVSTKNFKDADGKRLTIKNLVKKEIVFSVKKKNYDFLNVKVEDPPGKEILALVKLFESVILNGDKISLEMQKLENEYFELLKTCLIGYFKKNKIDYNEKDLNFNYRFNANLLL